jgi:uncharacterized protein YkwD
MKYLAMAIFIFVMLFSGCSSTKKDSLIKKTSPSSEELYQSAPISDAKNKATPHGLNILKTGRQMTLIDKEILPGGGWDYANEVYYRAGYPTDQRDIIFKSNKKGPYADISLIQPGDWLYYINHWHGEIEHSAIFINWIDYDNKEGLMLSYGGENRQEPARYMSYDLTNTYYIVRPKSSAHELFEDNEKNIESAVIGDAAMGSSFTQEEVRIMINLHNKARLEVNVDKITWSNELAAYAQEWTDHLASSGCKMAHRDHGKYGESIYWSSADNGVENVIINWLKEKKFYYGQVLNTSNWYKSGHYTQVVWSESEKIGCGKTKCSSGAVIVFCNYYPRGNYLGEKPY